MEEPVSTQPISGSLDIKSASELARTKLAEVLEKLPNATTSIVKTGDDWEATVEVVEEEYLPGQNLRSMNDLIGVYQVVLSHNGELLSWAKKGTHKRGHL
jgi:hypothetical protein